MKKETKTLLGILAAIAVVFVIALALYNPKNQTPEADLAASQQQQQPMVVDADILVRPDSPTMGPADARVTVVEYLDPECESCGAIYPYVKDILNEYSGKVRFVVRYMPYHGNSRLASIAAESAGRQDKYWEMLDLLFTRQLEWGHKQEPQTETFVRYAEELGLNKEQFTADLKDEALAQKIDRDAKDGEKIGIRGTPTFFVNQRQLEQLDPSLLSDRIRQELNP